MRQRTFETVLPHVKVLSVSVCACVCVRVCVCARDLSNKAAVLGTWLQTVGDSDATQRSRAGCRSEKFNTGTNIDTLTLIQIPEQYFFHTNLI